MIFDILSTAGHEQVVYCHNPDAGLRAIIALHNTTLGPALGGVRMRPYASEAEALADVLRLSRTMTYKNAMAGLNVGGGKAVIFGNPKTDKTEVLFRAFGRYVDAMGGRYITAEDVGTDVTDMEHVYLESAYVTGVHQAHGGSGDPAPFTAYGALQGMRATSARRLGHEDLSRLRIAVQGLGHIGMELVKLLRDHGATLLVSDLDPARVQRAVTEFGATAVDPAQMMDVQADLLAPCALEGGLDTDCVARLQVQMVCGTANNQLADEAAGAALAARGILYAPDYVVNAGGVMNVSLEIDGYNRERAMRLIRSINTNLGKVFDHAERTGMTPQQAADQIALARINAIGKLKLPLGRATPRMSRLRGE
jgi:leucine dehydrogenase